MIKNKSLNNVKSREDLNKLYMELMRDAEKTEYDMWRLSSRCGIFFWAVAFLDFIFTGNVTVYTYLSVPYLIGFVILIAIEE